MGLKEPGGSDGKESIRKVHPGIPVAVAPRDILGARPGGNHGDALGFSTGHFRVAGRDLLGLA